MGAGGAGVQSGSIVYARPVLLKVEIVYPTLMWKNGCTGRKCAERGGRWGAGLQEVRRGRPVSAVLHLLRKSSLLASLSVMHGPVRRRSAD